MIQSPQNKYRIIFADIIRGFSKVITPDFGTIFIKHFTSLDSSDMELKYSDLFEKAKNKGLTTESDKLALLKQQDLWNDAKDAEINQLNLYISNLKETKKKLFKEAELKQLSGEIEANESKLLSLKTERINLIGLTVEGHASKKINDYYIHQALFKDDKLSLPLYNLEEFSELSQSDFSKLIRIYNTTMTHFNEKNFKNISISSFFCNFYYLCDDNVYSFYGKPVVHLTFYQGELFGYAKYFKNMIANSEVKPPSELYDDPDKLIEWITSSTTARKLLEKNPDSAGASLVGASKEDYKKIGVDTSTDTKKLFDLAKEKGGQLGIEDLMKLHNN